MSGIATAIIGSAVIGGGIAAYSSSKASDAAESAAATQSASQQQAINEQRSQFDSIQKLLAPYTQAGLGALQGMQGLAGLRGATEQQAAIDQIKQSAQYQELAQQGEQGILQNASATGGLRGGNIQAALAQFRPALLNQLIESQYSKLAGLTQLGQASATGTAAAGQQSAQNVGNLMVGQGQAQAGGIVGAANAQAQGGAGISSAIGGGVQNYQLMQALNRGGLSGYSVPQQTAIGQSYVGNFPGSDTAIGQSYVGF
jgi:hypothetical protein